MNLNPKGKFENAAIYGVCLYWSAMSVIASDIREKKARDSGDLQEEDIGPSKAIQEILDRAIASQNLDVLSFNTGMMLGMTSLIGKRLDADITGHFNAYGTRGYITACLDTKIIPAMQDLTAIVLGELDKIGLTKEILHAHPINPLPSKESHQPLTQDDLRIYIVGEYSRPSIDMG